MKRTLLLACLFLLAACGSSADQQAGAETGKVTTSGKEQTALAAVPKEVLDTARAAQPAMTFTEAEAEVRERRNYYDLAGRLPDGSEIELDLLQQPEGWTVIETQRDIAFASAPEPVRAASAKADAKFTPVRVIESSQNDGVVIYELFGPPQNGGAGRKVELKYDGTKAELLTEEWAH